MATNAPDLFALAEALRNLREVYRLLRPELRDPEKVTLRVYRLQQQGLWIVNSYGRYLPEDFVYRFRGAIGRVPLTLPFDQYVPSRRSILRLRKLTRELLHLTTTISTEAAPRDDTW